MFLLDDVVVYSPTDLAVAATCEYALLCRLDVKLGRRAAVAVDDPLMARAAELGDRHELKVLRGFTERFGSGVVEIPAPSRYSAEKLLEARDATRSALDSRADVVFQGSFFDGRFHGRSDFLELRADGYAVLDTKLARHAKVTALLQLAAYADQLERDGVPLHPKVGLLLGNGTQPEFPVQELLAVYRHRRQRAQDVLDRHQELGQAADWQTTHACGRCDDCTAAAEAARDVLLVAGLRVTQRARLREAGVTTVEELASSSGPVMGVGRGALERLRHQARLQSAQDERPPLPDGRPDVRHEVVDASPLQALHRPDDGDLFFDFEGDPLWDDGDGKGGLEYLFGVVEADTGEYVSWLAHDREQEHAALRSFLDYVSSRRDKHPAMHVYHYANYERAALARLAAHAQYGEDVVDDLFRHGVLVDLYSTVKEAVRVSQRSYSIKKLEPLYMGDDLRHGVDSGGASVAEYAKYTELSAAGDADAAEQVLQGIVDYNAYDCRSTRELRDWLLGLVERDDAMPADAPVADASGADAGGADELVTALLVRAEQLGTHPDARPYALLAAAVGYHRREDKPAWWEHFARLRDPVEDWGDSRDVFVVDEVVTATDWVKPNARSQPRRTLTLSGSWGAGSLPGSRVLPVFAVPCPEGLLPPQDGCRAVGPQADVEVVVGADGRELVEVRLALKKGQAPYPDVPVALVPGTPISTASIVAALRSLAESARTDLPTGQPGVELLRRSLLPPLPRATSDRDLIGTVTEAVVLRHGSYVAVQGPPGTGKTHLGARVVAALVARGWRIGVVAQSHAVVCHFLDAVVAAGVDPAKVAKAEGSLSGSWTDIVKGKEPTFLDQEGCVLGGTAWDFTNASRVTPRQLDLLVVDEAGQYSLANTLAASVSAQRLLLLGDPQQLPQVSRGTHPEPVDASALAWLMEGEATLPPERGYFLPLTWRMHPALATKVSQLSYDGRLASEPGVAGRRRLDGLAAGLHVRPVPHTGNDVSSPEEAAEVVRVLQSVIGSTWSCDGSPDRAIGTSDLLVVAAYNAQVAEIRRHLATAGLTDVLVGTVDKLQGREAPVVCVSLAASSAADVPRGIDFLLSRNRLNVAVSRGQWATFLVHSPALADHLPTTPGGLQQLGAYLSLVTDGAS